MPLHVMIGFLAQIWRALPQILLFYLFKSNHLRHAIDNIKHWILISFFFFQFRWSILFCLSLFLLSGKDNYIRLHLQLLSIPRCGCTLVSSRFQEVFLKIFGYFYKVRYSLMFLFFKIVIELNQVYCLVFKISLICFFLLI